MNVIQYVMEAIVSNGLVIGLFFKINHIKFTRKSLVIAVLIRILVAAITATLNRLVGDSLFGYFTQPLYGFLFTLIFLKPKSKTLLIFYGLFTSTLWNIFSRLIAYFIVPIFGQTDVLLEDGMLYFLYVFFSILSTLGFLQWLGYDFVRYRFDLIDFREKRGLLIANWTMATYFLLMQALTYFEYEYELVSHSYRKLILVLYLILFMGMLKQVDTYLKEKMKEKLIFQQTLQLSDLEKYSKHIEELYREVRGFRHDYTNLLTTLRLSIEDNNMSQIKEIYESVLKDSPKRLQYNKYDVGRLLNIDNSALKSLLAAKFMQATEQNLIVSLEVPEVIEPQGMELVDFLTIISILCDNATEAAIGTVDSRINIAFLTVHEKQMFIIENSTKEEAVDISEIYSFGTSSKGSDRGVGLYNVTKILEQYPNVWLRTRSSEYTFSQILEIG
ncbi:sensor histidine kinase [Streptococcus acidominimus]|uniref:GHKL domain-containing protein n=1 Tax=Streptococcus acidominimus TaxID=1326 RepID=A0A4Y9FQJ9_STRAI|nr:GHKL domain-containing protein [Streptococcus acidominimus]MBF0818200.1 GHKL domain-containing protein [Streptococcus acidominimus]MBF0838517.1 GHKL domain-containing protein [Streptococcus acidominimus]MBF0848445.1 GHKL domain-containing protein [Streptococcus danieliae]TFU31504.1 GHKL domain-containing protein [Streptococcus acidominimus]